jgi:hypothetical protein
VASEVAALGQMEKGMSHFQLTCFICLLKATL